MTVFFMAIKRILSQPVNWVFIILFPIVFSIIITSGNNYDPDNPWVESGFIPVGIVDHDNSLLSHALIRQLDLRLSTIMLDEDEISHSLTSVNNVAWILVIQSGYEENIVSGITPQLDSYSLIINDVAILADRLTENITRALMILGTNDPDTLDIWEESSRLDIHLVGDTSINWEAISQLASMYGFIAIFMAYFIIRSLMDDKQKGMPERLGVLPLSPRKIMIQGTLAAFASTLIASVILLWLMNSRLDRLVNLGYLFTLLALFNLFTVAFVFAIFSSVKNLAIVSVVVTMVANILSMLGGLFWPLEMVPHFMQRIAWFTPTYWFGRGLRNIGDIGFEGFVIPILFLLAFTVVAMIFGGWKRIQGIEE